MEIKSALFLIRNNLFFIIILCIIINKTNLYLSFTYPNCLHLSNGNIFVIHKYGISICNSDFTQIVTNITKFQEDDIITEANLAKITSVFGNGYIFNIINDKIYIFNSIGTLLYENATKIISNEENPSYYTLVPINIYNGYYIYIIGFNDNNYLHFLYYKFDIENNQNILHYSLKNFAKSLFISSSYYIEGKSLTCQYLKNETTNEFLTCFYLIHKFSDNTHTYIMAVNLFDINENGITDNTVYDLYKFGKFKYIKSTINYNHLEAFVCIIDDGGEAYHFNYIIGHKPQGGYITHYNSSTNYYGMKIDYLNETKNYVINFIGKELNFIVICFFNSKLENIKKLIKVIEGCQSIYGHSILYSNSNNNKDNYYLISDNIVNNKIAYPLFEIVINKTYDSDTQDEGDTDTQKEEDNKDNDILAEEEENKEEEYIEEDFTQNEMKKCKENEKCEECNVESLKMGLCLKCNNEKGYYSFKNPLLDINNNFIDCINNMNKPENFYFNKEKNSFEECYETCKACDFGGDRDQNNCTICENNYIFEPDTIKNTNCVLECSNFYYYS